jgi:hypothetical protein
MEIKEEKKLKVKQPENAHAECSKSGLIGQDEVLDYSGWGSNCFSRLFPMNFVHRWVDGTKYMLPGSWQDMQPTVIAINHKEEIRESCQTARRSCCTFLVRCTKYVRGTAAAHLI